MDRIDWKLLQEIYKEKSMSKAADKLFISQPAVSYRLQKMEAEYQRPLFIRTSRGVALTEAGMRLYGFASRMLLYDDEITASVQLDPSEYSGHIRIGATTTFTNYFLIRQLQEFCDIYKNISIFVDLYPSMTLFDMFLSGELKVAIVRGNYTASKDQSCLTLLTEPMMIIAKQPITLDYLRTHPFIQNISSIYKSISSTADEWIAENFPEPPQISHIQISGDSRVMVQLVNSGFGWTIISKSRLIEGDALYSQPLLRPDGSPYQYATQLFYSNDVENLETYHIYLQHLKNHFAMTYGNALT